MKKYMPLEGLRWSRDSGSTLCDTPQNGRSRTGWGADCYFVEYQYFALMSMIKEIDINYFEASNKPPNFTTENN